VGAEKYDMYFDQRGKRWMALCVLGKATMLQSLSVRRIELSSKLESLLAEARDWAKKGRTDLLNKTFVEISLVLTELSLSLSTDVVLGGKEDVGEVLGDYYR
jgi:hypothetical protein